MNKDTRTEYEISKEVRSIIASLDLVRANDLPEYFLLRDELKKEFGEEFYNRWFKEALEIDWKVS